MVGGVTTEFDRARAVLDVDDTDEAQDFARGGGFFLLGQNIAVVLGKLLHELTTLSMSRNGSGTRD